VYCPAPQRGVVEVNLAACDGGQIVAAVVGDLGVQPAGEPHIVVDVDVDEAVQLPGLAEMDARRCLSSGSRSLMTACNVPPVAVTRFSPPVWVRRIVGMETETDMGSHSF
jgi:hypothetical protein